MLRLLTIALGCFLVAQPATAVVARHRPVQQNSKNKKNRTKRAAKNLGRAAAKYGKAVVRILRPLPLEKIPEVSAYEGLLEELNQMADNQGFFIDPSKKNLVPFRSDKYLFVDPAKLKPHQRFILPCVEQELNQIKIDYFETFETRLRVTQAYRTKPDQNNMSRLIKRWFRIGRKKSFRLVPANVNAADADGPKASLHRRALALDFGRGQLKPAQDKWLQHRFAALNSEKGFKAAVQEDGRTSPNYHVVFCLQKIQPELTTTPATQ